MFWLSKSFDTCFFIFIFGDPEPKFLLRDITHLAFDIHTIKREFDRKRGLKYSEENVYLIDQGFGV